MYFVYELVDPRNNVTGYISITNNPNQRYYDHIEGRERQRKRNKYRRRNLPTVTLQLRKLAVD